MSKHVNAEGRAVNHFFGGAALEGDERDVSGAAELFGGLLTALTEHAPTPEASAHWEGMISDEEALHDGVHVSSDRVLAAAMTEYAVMVPYLLEAPLPGYGPRRAHYALSMAVMYAETYADFLKVEARRAGVSETKGMTLQEARERRAMFVGLLQDAAGGDPGLQAAVAKAARRGTRAPGEVSASLQGLSTVARELLTRAGPGTGLSEALGDMGLTLQAVTRAEEAALSLGAARGMHDAERATHRVVTAARTPR